MITTICLLLNVAPTSYAANSDSAASWDYSASKKGPAHWGDFYPNCKAGGYQSPVNLVSAHISKSAQQPISLAVQALKGRVLNDDHEIEVLAMNPLNHFMTLGNVSYALQQLHFHSPSENEIDGKKFLVEIHFVTQNSQGQLGVLAVFITSGQSNEALSSVLSHVGQGNLALSPPELESLFPADKRYYSFEGSLTTPACDRDVTWVVLKAPITASSAQIKQLQAWYTGNARPIQAMNSRIVEAGVVNPAS